VRPSEAYRSRSVEVLGLWEWPGWRIKAYGIAYADAPLDSRLTKAARGLTEGRLKASAETTSHYGVGFAGVHQGKTGNFVFVDWWADENELHHHVYVSPPDRPEALEYQTPTGLAACVWDLFLIGYERDAWVRHVLRSKGNLDAYVRDRFQGRV